MEGGQKEASQSQGSGASVSVEQMFELRRKSEEVQETREQPFLDCQLNEKEEKEERAKKRKKRRKEDQSLEEEDEEEVEVRDDASSVKQERKRSENQREKAS